MKLNRIPNYSLSTVDLNSTDSANIGVSSQVPIPADECYSVSLFSTHTGLIINHSCWNINDMAMLYIAFVYIFLKYGILLTVYLEALCNSQYDQSYHNI
jgi:hypothetical protein